MSTLNHQPLNTLVTGANADLGKDIARRRQPHDGQLRVLVGKERLLPPESAEALSAS